MAKRNGGIIGPDNPTSPFVAGGVWRLEDAFNAQKAGTWPVVLGYQVPNSLRFNSGSSDYLNRTPASAGNRQIWTYSFWFKRSNLGSGNYYLLSSGTYPPYDDTGSFQFTIRDDIFQASTGANNLLATAPLYRDVSAWYHVVLSVDTTQATANNRLRFYVNGTELTASEKANSGYAITSIPQNTSMSINNNVIHTIGKDSSGNYSYLSGYLSEVYMIDGQQLTPSSFGQTDSTTGIWIPKAYTGTYGTNGFYLNFANSADLGNDVSGNNNDFTANNLTSIDQSYDSPTNNFATMNPLKPTSDATFSNGNLTVLYGTSATRTVGQGTIGVSSGKWFWENKISGSVSPNNAIVGITSNSNDTDTVIGTSSNNFGYRGYDGAVYNNNASVASLSTFTDGDIIGIALDLTNNLIYFYKNGTVQNSGTGISISGATNTSGFWYPAISDAGSSATPQFDMNFGYPPFTISSGNADGNGFGNFEYAVPSGYYALCSKNLALYG